MKFETFQASTKFDGQSEIERAKLVAVYKRLREGKAEFSAGTMASWFKEAGLAAPNRWRLDRAMRASRHFIRTEGKGFQLSSGTLQEFRSLYSELESTDEIVEVSEDVLPATLYEATRGYLESLGRQINKCYSERLFDGCAVLMRRLLEVLVILAFRSHGQESLIVRNDVHVSLERMLDTARSASFLSLSRSTREALDDFRILGNFAAHRIEYATRRSDIDGVRLKYRGAIEELLYKSGVRT